MLTPELLNALRANVAMLLAGGPEALGLQAAVIAGIIAAAWIMQAALRWALRRQRRAEGVTEAEASKTPLARWPLIALGTAVLCIAAGRLLEMGGYSHRLVADFGQIALAAGGVQVVLTVIGRTPLGWLVSLTVVVVAVVSVLGLSAPLIEALDAPGVVLGKVRLSPWFVVRALVVFGALLWLASRAGRLIEKQAEAEKFLSPSSRALMGKLVHFALIVLATFIGLATLGVDVTALAVFSGALGLGLGFGLQRIVANFVAGLVLLADKSVKPGDVIEIDFTGMGSTRGRVTMLGARFTAITTRMGTETLVPNDMLISNPVTNWSHSSHDVQIRIPLRVAYTSDVELARKLCVEASHRPGRVLAYPTANCLVVGFGESSVEFEVRYWIRDPENGVRNISSEVYLEIWRAFRQHGIEIPLSQHDLHIRTPVNVRVHTSDDD